MAHHVLHLLGTARPEGTGIARIVSGLAGGLDPARYRLHAWFLGDEGPLVDELRRAGASVRVVNWQRGARDPVGAARFLHALRGQKFAIIHQHFGGRSVRWIGRRATRATLITHLHGGAPESRSWHRRCRVGHGRDVIIANSRAVASRMVGASPVVIYPGVDTGDHGGAAPPVTTRPRSTVVGTACRLVPAKGVRSLVQALATLRREAPDVRLEIAGSGPDQAAIEHEIQSLGLADRVRMLGWRSDVASLMSKWDVYVQPSLDEGFGIAVLEAMAVGLPVIATAAGGLPELVEQGRTGWLVAPGDSDALAERLRALVLDSERRRAMGAAGKARARDSFSSDQMVSEIARLYDNLVEKTNENAEF